MIRILAGIGDGSIASEEPVILLADDLTPSETVSLDKSKILAFVTRNGSANSHTAILARWLFRRIFRHLFRPMWSCEKNTTAWMQL